LLAIVPVQMERTMLSRWGKRNGRQPGTIAKTYSAFRDYSIGNPIFKPADQIRKVGTMQPAVQS